MADASPYTTDHAKSFKNKLGEIEKAHKDFWGIEYAASDVEGYFSEQYLNHKYGSQERTWLQPDPKFRDPKDYNFAKDGRLFRIIDNYHSFDAIQHQTQPGSAGMSMIHVLMIPKERIFNAVSLNHKNAEIIKIMKGFFQREWRNNEDFRKEIVKHQEKAIELDKNMQLAALEKDEGDYEDKSSAIIEAYETALRHYEELESKALELNSDEFHFGFHLYPHHSIGHLHMHVIASPQELRKYSTSKNDKRTVDAMEVVEFIEKVPKDHPSNQRGREVVNTRPHIQKVLDDVDRQF